MQDKRAKVQRCVAAKSAWKLRLLLHRMGRTELLPRKQKRVRKQQCPRLVTGRKKKKKKETNTDAKTNTTQTQTQTNTTITDHRLQTQTQTPQTQTDTTTNANMNNHNAKQYRATHFLRRDPRPRVK